MTTAGAWHSIPMDLRIEILLKLPAKSVLRFKSVSKLWCSIINSGQFINAYMSRPHLVLVFNNSNDDKLLFFSSPHQSCSFSSSSSLRVAKNYSLANVNCHANYYISNSVRGFVCCFLQGRYVVCNPTTRQVIRLGHQGYHCRMYLGYDPNSYKYKVLRLMAVKPLRLGYDPNRDNEYSVCTLGSSDSSWRPIQFNIPYRYSSPTGVCIDGIVYYEFMNPKNSCWSLGSFDVGSELLSFIETPEKSEFTCELTNYMGKLGVYYCTDNGFNLWVLDDVKNEVWSKTTYLFPINSKLSNVGMRFGGITPYGELVYVPERFSSELLCYDAENKVERRVIVEGVSDINSGVRCSLLCSYVNNIIFL